PATYWGTRSTLSSRPNANAAVAQERPRLEPDGGCGRLRRRQRKFNSCFIPDALPASAGQTRPAPPDSDAGAPDPGPARSFCWGVAGHIAPRRLRRAPPNGPIAPIWPRGATYQGTQNQTPAIHRPPRHTP